ncbi:MAG: hydrolase TatD [Gammaproteobacteria bacterium]|nr:hydrolase TatD [Gammaproteobacteria bacterium]|tara:strand:+ start:191 stop:985 length:795 start_codon:yes stop_codon:yes gene_type:complete
MAKDFSLIDIGANLTHDQLLKNIHAVIDNFKKVHVENVIITSSNTTDTEKALSLIKKFPNLFYTTVGFHPHNAKNFKEKDLESIETLANNPHVISIGECGLDYYREYSPKNQQIVCFEKQLSLNTKLNLPLFLHERGAHNDFCSLLKKYIDRIDNTVVHCFTGTKQELLQYLDMGCYIGITGWITDMERGSHLHEIIQYIPEDRLLVETDSPYLIPKNMNDNRKTTNEPAYLPYVVEEIANCLNKDVKYISNKTFENTKKFFQI